MSRNEFENDKYMVAIGVDLTPIGHSSFFQIWNQPHDDRDGAALIIDHLGVSYQARSMNADLGDRLPEEVEKYIAVIEAKYRSAKEKGNPYPNVDHETISKFLKLLDFKDINVYDILN